MLFRLRRLVCVLPLNDWLKLQVYQVLVRLESRRLLRRRYKAAR